MQDGTKTRLIAFTCGMAVAFSIPMWDMSVFTAQSKKISVTKQPLQDHPTKNRVSHIGGFDQQEYCLARNIYFEARGQSRKGQIAVGLVTLNRVERPEFQDTVCKVVHEPWQFSWLWIDTDRQVREPKAYQRARNIASALLSKESAIEDFTDGATHYHKYTVSPNWNGVKYLFAIEDHLFYRKTQG